MYERVVKRLMDRLLSLLAGIVLAIPMLIVALLIKLDDPGPAVFKQKRVGKGKTYFWLYKFRSMKMDTPDVPTHLLGHPEQYITRIGRFIRKYSIDELPQLINILNGTMSIVGPRPVAEDQFDMFRYGKWNEAAKVPVGLSGPAALYDYIYGDQITDEAEYMEKVYPTRRELEYTYVQKAGLWYDLKMIVYTVICIIYSLCGKECTWILNELVEDANKTINQ